MGTALKHDVRTHSTLISVMMRESCTRIGTSVCACSSTYVCNNKRSPNRIEAGEKHASASQMASSTAKENHRAQWDGFTGRHTALSMGTTLAAKAHTGQQASCSGSALSRTSGTKGIHPGGLDNYFTLRGE